MVGSDLNVWDKLDLLERYHSPVYLGPEFRSAYFNSTPLSDDADRLRIAETIEVYERCLGEATEVARQARVLQSFVSNFPDLVWYHSWLKNLWEQLRQQDTKKARRLLRAIGNGFATPVYRLRKFLQQQKVDRARQMYWKMLKPGLCGSNPLMLSLQTIRGAGGREEVIEMERPKMEKCLQDLDCRLSVSAVLKKHRSDHSAPFSGQFL